MLKKIDTKSNFINNVLTLITGTFLAQLIPILILPILTRLWLPEEFGFFATFVAVISILEVLFMGRFDMALMLPKKNENALNLLLLGFILSIFFAVLIYSFLLIESYFNFFKIFEIQNWYFLVPISAIIYSTYSLIIAWNNRLKKYKVMSSNRVIQSSSIAFAQIIIGYVSKFNLGLIYADLLGRFFSLFLILKNSKLFFYNIRFNYLKKLALFKRYKNFLILEAPASLMNVCSNQLPFIVLPIIFSPKIAGLYFLVFKVLMMPSALIGTAVLEVFKNKVQEDFLNKGNFKKIFIKTALSLFLIGIIPTLILIIFASEIFVFFFGDDWIDAGKYAEILAPLALARFVSSPLSYILVFKEKLLLDLKLQILFFVFIIVSLYFSAILNSIEAAIWMLMISGILFYMLQIFYSYKISLNE